MYLYIWKDSCNTPFYVGLTVRFGRTNPKNNGGRNWLTKKKLDEVGADNVIVELHTVPDAIKGREMEKALIEQYGRIQTGTGPLTNLRSGGEGLESPSAEHREKLRQAMLDPNHPIRSPEARAKQRERMKDPDVRALFAGDKNPAKKPEVRAKLVAVWQNEEYRSAQIDKKIGRKLNISDKAREDLATRLANNPKMLGWDKRNGNPEFDAKRIAGIRAAQPKRLEKMRDPEALALRKERLKATMSTPEYKAKRALYDTPEYRKKLSDAKKAYWAKRRLEKKA